MSVRVELTDKQKSKQVSNKKYRLKNKQKTGAYNRAYYKANKEAIKKYNREYKQKLNHTATVVYAIINYDGIGNVYVGMTNSLDRRRYNHRSNGKQNTDTMYILSVHLDRAKAKEMEAKFHAEGYHGAHQRDNCELTKELEKNFKL